MSIRIRCHHCKRWNEIPDGEGLKVYAATGGLIQTLTERIITEVVHKHYSTPGPLWKSLAPTVLQTFCGPAEVKLGLDPFVAFGLIGVTLAIGLVIASTEVEEHEIDDDSDGDEEPEQQEIAPTPVIEISKPGPNSISIRRVHEPPLSDDNDPKINIRLARADLELAKLATSTAYPMEPISWTEAQRRQWNYKGFNYGEKTFYAIQRHWLDEGIAFSTSSKIVYLKPRGRKTLTQYVEQNSIPLPHNSAD